MPEELAVQMPLLKEVLDDMGIRRYELEGYEADDILGTAAAICEQEDWNCVIVTGDKDSLQLISDKSYVCNVKTRMGQTETIIYDPSRLPRGIRLRAGPHGRSEIPDGQTCRTIFRRAWRRREDRA